jgi:hypothetical protein
MLPARTAGARHRPRLQPQAWPQIARLEGDRDAVDTRIQRLRLVHDHLVTELTVDDDLIAEYGSTENPSAAAG